MNFAVVDTGELRARSYVEDGWDIISEICFGGEMRFVLDYFGPPF